MSKLDAIKEPVFEPVVEIEPYSYSDRESPLMSAGQVANDEFKRYLTSCLMDAGLDHLTPIMAESMYYKTRELDRDSVSTIVKHELRNWPTEEDYAQIENVRDNGSSLYGGIAVLDGRNCITVPGCCCGIDSLREWRQMLEEKPADWSNLWVGHDVDSLEVKYHQNEDAFQFRISKWETSAWDREFAMPQQSFHEAVGQLEQHANEFKALVEEVLDVRFVGQKCRSAIACRMAGLA